MATAEQLTKEVISARTQKAADRWVGERVAEIVRYAKEYIDGHTKAKGLTYHYPIPAKFYDQVDAVYSELKAHFPDSYVTVTLDIPPTWKCWRGPDLVVKISW